MNALSVGDQVSVSMDGKVVGFLKSHGIVVRVLVEIPEQVHGSQVVLTQVDKITCRMLGDAGVDDTSR